MYKKLAVVLVLAMVFSVAASAQITDVYWTTYYSNIGTKIRPSTSSTLVFRVLRSIPLLVCSQVRAICAPTSMCSTRARKWRNAARARSRLMAFWVFR